MWGKMLQRMSDEIVRFTSRVSKSVSVGTLSLRSLKLLPASRESGRLFLRSGDLSMSVIKKPQNQAMARLGAVVEKPKL
eukprot:1395353-Amorphochlora_amoeboformis.AAC.2